MPALSHPDLDIQATRIPPPPPHLPTHTTATPVSSDNSICLWSVQWTSTQSSNSHRAGMVKPHHCAELSWTGCPLSQIKGASSSDSVAEHAASGDTHYYMRGGTCDLFNYSALHFYPTIQNATWELIASKIHLYNLPQAHKLPNFGAGVDELCRHKQIPFTAEQSHITAVCWGRGGAKLNGAALLLAGNGRGKKKYTCYLVNPQTCKIGISWMSATEMELTRDLFIVTEGH